MSGLAWARALRATGLVFSVAGAASLCACDQRSAASEVPADAAHTLLSLQEIECQSCGMSVAQALEATAGVYAVSFEQSSAEISVAYDATQVGPAAFIELAHALGYRASEGPGEGAYTPEVVFPPELDAQEISKAGEAVEISDYIVPGKVTIFDFHAVWCGPCKAVDRHMLSVLRERDDVALRKLNVVDWDSALTKRYLQDVPNIPYLIVYGRDGQRVAEISGLAIDQLDAAIEAGLAR